MAAVSLNIPLKLSQGSGKSTAEAVVAYRRQHLWSAPQVGKPVLWRSSRIRKGLPASPRALSWSTSFARNRPSFQPSSSAGFRSRLNVARIPQRFSEDSVPMASEAHLENVQVLLVRDPSGRRVEAQDMEVAKTPFTVPPPLEPNTLALRNLYLTLDPYMRGRMNVQRKGYFPPFQLGSVLQTVAVSEVMAGERDGVKAGDTVVASMVGWEKYTLAGPSVRIRKVDPTLPFSPSLLLGVLGLTGATAYYGLTLCDAKPGQTLFVSGAAGAVGLAVGQIAKIQGLKVIGSAGTDEKVRFLTEECGFDAAFNYRTCEGKIQDKLAELAPEGLDGYFDNVGGEHLDAALGSMKMGGRVSACGMIALYNGESYAYKNMPCVVFKQIRMQGFLIGAQLSDPEFMGKFQADMGGWIAEGKVNPMEHVVEGIEKAPEAFVGLFEGVNTGKLIIKI